MVPSNDISEAEAEGVVLVILPDECGDVIRVLLQLRELASLTYLRVCYDNEVVTGVILLILSYDEIVFPDIF